MAISFEKRFLKFITEVQQNDFEISDIDYDNKLVSFWAVDKSTGEQTILMLFVKDGTYSNKVKQLEIKMPRMVKYFEKYGFKSYD